MLQPGEAVATILGRVRALDLAEAVPIAAATGRVLARDLASDVDLPPFEKSAMDGFAVHAADFAADLAPNGERSLPIVGESRAGAPFAAAVPRGACAAIYTGAEVPRDCDAVVVVEVSELAADGRSVVLRDRPSKGQNICKRGQDLARGDAVLAAGRRVRAIDLALLAAIGCDPVPVIRRPRVAVLTSGDELVAPRERPGVGQIREGNTLHLSAMSEAAGAEVANLGIVRDDLDVLASAFESALASCDVLITTGGVSMGKYDLVGSALERAGVQGLFHRVAIKPGKPLWFGVRGDVLVFALPGNPVSCLVNHELFVAPALRRLGGEAGVDAVPRMRRGRWSGGPVAANSREQYLPVRVRFGEDGVDVLDPVRWNGSADVVGISRCDGLAVVPIDAVLEPGQLVAYREYGARAFFS